MFYLNEKVVYPGHGVAEVSRILEKNIGGKTTRFFELKVMSNDITILIPINNLESKGIRKISSQEVIDSLYMQLSTNKELKITINASSWAKRSKQYQTEIGSGDINKIMEIYKYLNHMSQRKELSFGEKALLHQAEALLVQEISIVREIDKDRALVSLRSFFDSNIEEHMVKASVKTKM